MARTRRYARRRHSAREFQGNKVGRQQIWDCNEWGYGGLKGEVRGMNGGRRGVPGVDGGGMGAGGAVADVAEDEPTGDGEDKEKEHDANPAEAELVGSGRGRLNSGGLFGVGEPFILLLFVGGGGLVDGGEAVEPGVFVQTEAAEVAAKDAAVEDAAGEQVEALVLKGAEVADADLGGLGDLLQGDAGFFAFHLEVGAEIAHKCRQQTEECLRQQCNPGRRISR